MEMLQWLGKFMRFFTFAKIGLFTFGGGYAMISIIENNCVERKKWMTHDEMMNMTVIAESTPGPIAINCATFVGYKRAGIMGAVISTFGVVLPSFFVILKTVLKNKYVQAVLQGLKPCVVGIVLATGVYMIVTNCLRFGSETGLHIQAVIKGILQRSFLQKGTENEK